MGHSVEDLDGKETKKRQVSQFGRNGVELFPARKKKKKRQRRLEPRNPTDKSMIIFIRRYIFNAGIKIMRMLSIIL